MRDVCSLIWLALIGLFRSRASLQAEILTLRHQLNVLRRKSPQRLTFSSIDRLVFAGLYRLAPGVLDAFEDRQAGDRDPLASCRLPSVLALEIKTARWPPKDPVGSPSAHSRDESRQPIMPSVGSWSNACGGYRCPSGAVIAMSRQPSSASSAAFFRAAAAVSRRSVMRPEVSVPVIKNRMCDPIAGH